MKQSKYQPLITPLLKKSMFTAQEARSRGVPSRMLDHFCRKGIIERMGRGVYRSTLSDHGTPPDLEGLVLTALSIPKGVICLISALYYYDLTDEIMRRYWIAIPNTRKKSKRLHAKIVRMRNMSLGLRTVKIGKHKVKIFNRERTIIDSFRYLSQEVAIKALQAYLKSSPNLAKLAKYAKALRINIHRYIMALTT